MELTGGESNPQPAPMKSELMTDKDEIIRVLNDLVANYPSDEIPFEVFEQALSKFTTPRDGGRLQHHPAVQKLDQILNQFRNPRTSTSH